MSVAPELSLVKSLATPAMGGLFVDMTDTLLDVAITSGALDGIPVVGLFTGTAKAAREVRDRLFVRKISQFLRSFCEATDQEREAFVSSMGGEEERFKVGEAILMLIEQAEDMQKPVVIGRLFAAAARGRLTLSSATRIAKMVNRSYSEDLPLLQSFTAGVQRGEQDRAAGLYASGFLSFAGIDGGVVSDEESAGVLYEMSEYGSALVEHGLLPP